WTVRYEALHAQSRKRLHRDVGTGAGRPAARKLCRPMTDARLQDGFRAHQAGDLDKAERLYRDILSADATNFDALYLLGYVHLQRGEWDSAERRIGEAVTINPNSIVALFNRARALANLGRQMEALSCLDRALSLRGGIPELLLTRGNVLLALNRAAEAL